MSAAPRFRFQSAGRRNICKNKDMPWMILSDRINVKFKQIYSYKSNIEVVV